MKPLSRIVALGLVGTMGVISTTFVGLVALGGHPVPMEIYSLALASASGLTGWLQHPNGHGSNNHGGTHPAQTHPDLQPAGSGLDGNVLPNQ